MHSKPKIGDIVKLTYSAGYTVFLRIEILSDFNGRYGFNGYLIDYIDESNNPALPVLKNKNNVNCTAYSTYKILKSIDEVMVEMI